MQLALSMETFVAAMYWSTSRRCAQPRELACVACENVMEQEVLYKRVLVRCMRDGS